ncbi:MAG: DUF6382 domain-containing protein [Lachnospiraceae bacterium]
MIQREEMNHYLTVWEVESKNQSRKCDMELQMLRYNDISFLLPMTVQELDGEQKFRYSLNQLLDLKTFFDNQMMALEEIKDILQQLLEIVDEMRPYMLSTDSLLLEPEYVFIQPDTRQLRMCYVPGYEGDCIDGFARIIEFFMNRMNHKDESAVVFVYGLYRMTKEEYFSLEQVKSWMNDTKSEKQSDWNVSTIQPEEEHVISEKMERKKPERKEPLQSGNMESYSGKKQPEPSYWEMVSKQEEVHTNIKLGLIQKLRIPCIILTGCLAGYSFFGVLSGVASNQLILRCILTIVMAGIYGILMKLIKNTREDLEFEKVREKPKATSEATTVLFQEPEKKTKKVHLVPIKGRNSPGTAIDKKTTILGSLQDAVDVYLSDSTVSRIHASIEEEEGEYYITDLQSTNGTWVNGKKLASRSPFLLRNKDHIELGRVEYEFQSQ